MKNSASLSPTLGVELGEMRAVAEVTAVQSDDTVVSLASKLAGARDALRA
jgi:hypothetical protein